jgi:hypothetical protein
VKKLGYNSEIINIEYTIYKGYGVAQCSTENPDRSKVKGRLNNYVM